MAPRNSDGNGTYKKNFPADDCEANPQDVVPCLLHKKHKVVKLVKDQMQKIQQEGLLCPVSGEDDKEELDIRHLYGGESFSRLQESGGRCQTSKWKCLLRSLIVIFLLVTLMVWISAGPLSNTIAHTPIPLTSFVRTERLCSLEKKYLLRWGKADYYE